MKCLRYRRRSAGGGERLRVRRRLGPAAVLVLDASGLGSPAPLGTQGWRVIADLPLPGIARPHGVLVDPESRLAFVAGEGSGRVGVLDLRTMRLRGTYRVGDRPDVLAMDPSRHLLFVAAESGVVAAFELHGDSLVALPRYRAPHAHSVAVDPATHLVYLPLERIEGRPVLRILALDPE